VKNLRKPTSTTTSSTTTFTKGSAVEGLYGGIWYKATVSKVHSSTVVDLDWADGTTSDRFEVKNLRNPLQ